ncbi:Protein of unknown function DUF3445 [Burkholderiales bacterium]
MTALNLLEAPHLGPVTTGWSLCEALPEPEIEVPHRVRPDLVKLGEAPVLLEDSEWSEWIDEKRGRLAKGRLVLIEPGLSLEALGRWALSTRQAFHARMPNGPVDQHGRFPWLGGFQAADALEFFEALSLSLQEDFAVMVHSEAGGLRAALLSVSFPSGWDPAQRIGQSMSALHEPVADGAALQRAMQTMSRAMLEKGPLMRTVWTLAGSASRARPPGEDDTASLLHADQLWFRHERQVTVPLGHGACLFLIRVMLAPFRAVVRSQAHHAQLLAALESMSPSMIAYKNLAYARRLVQSSRGCLKAGH